MGSSWEGGSGEGGGLKKRGCGWREGSGMSQSGTSDRDREAHLSDRGLAGEDVMPTPGHALHRGMSATCDFPSPPRYLLAAAAPTPLSLLLSPSLATTTPPPSRYNGGLKIPTTCCRQQTHPSLSLCLSLSLSPPSTHPLPCAWFVNR